ncbi:helix-turn-helix transcriptional regulator [Pseudonocardia halophobica]|uniref:helix-turn-helix transcriptional regulator n=1 Tax=Pseudonocardia halophobica TaxID=29401 RepID=UPI003D8D3EEB
MNRRILGIPEAATLLSRSPDTLRWWRKRNEGPPSFKIGRRVVYFEDELLAWVEEQRRESLPPGAA